MKKIRFNKKNGLVSDFSELLTSVLKMLPNGEYDMKIERHKDKRSINQNNMMWMWFTFIAMDIGDEPQFIHDYFCNKFSSTTRVIGHEQVVVPIRTSQLNTEQMTLFLDKVQKWCNEERGYTLPTPEDKMWEYFQEQVKNSML